MSMLIIGLLLFLGSHSVRVFAEGWRQQQFDRLGEKKWKALYTVISLLGFGLIVWGYGLARADPIMLWSPPVWTRHLAALLMLPAFVLLVAAYVPGTRIKARIGHPMLAGTKLWAAAHLISNGNLADVLLFGSFLAWAVADFVSCRKRDRLAGRSYPVLGWSRDAMAVVIGVIASGAFARFGHEWLIGVRPF